MLCPDDYSVFLPKLEEMDVRIVWSQQYRAKPHTSMTFYREHFPDRFISLGDNLDWPARSPDLGDCENNSLEYTYIPKILGEVKNIFVQLLPT